MRSRFTSLVIGVSAIISGLLVGGLDSQLCGQDKPEVREQRRERTPDAPQREIREVKRRIQELQELGKEDEANELKQRLEERLRATEAAARGEKAAKSQDDQRQRGGAVRKAQADAERQLQEKMMSHPELREIMEQIEQAKVELGPNHPRLLTLQQNLELRRQEIRARAESDSSQPDPRLVELQNALNRAIKLRHPEEVVELSNIIADHLRNQQPHREEPQSERPRPQDKPDNDARRYDYQRLEEPRSENSRREEMRREEVRREEMRREDVRRDDVRREDARREGGEPNQHQHMERQLQEMRAMLGELRGEIERLRRQMEELRREGR